LALRTESLKSSIDTSFSFIIPGKTLQKLLKMLSDTDTEVKINIAKKHAIFEMENIRVMTRLLEGEFLNYKNALPKDCQITIKAKTRDFIDSIERASLLISEKQRSPVRLKFMGDDVKLLCISPLGRVEDEFAVSSSGGEMEIGFNNKYLLDAFRSTDCEEVKIELKDSLAPMVIKPVEGNAFTFLVLPLRLKSEEA
jgi:DNA polymerase-3 subunit beta